MLDQEVQVSAAKMEEGSANFGMIGLGVMGRNLVLNIERHGYSVAVWNREPEWVDQFLNNKARGKQVVGAKEIRELVGSLEKPRKIMMMVKAGQPVDWTIDLLTPHLDEADIVVDGGNSHFLDTRRRERELAVQGVRFLGMGVSGGETGALRGPSLMPGGERNAYQDLRPILEAIAAQVEDGPCVTYCGPEAAGHFIKMVHNGIEYGDMQLIAEAYGILKSVLQLESGELSDIFSEWNEGLLESYLIEITKNIFTVMDEETGKPLIDLILDRAGQKGTGRWASQVALDLGVAVPTIHSAIEARILSGLKEERVQASQSIPGPETVLGSSDKKEIIDSVHDALYASKICSYAQGMALIQAGSEQYQWRVNLSEISRIWKGGCIIRARLLDRIQQAYLKQPNLPNLMVDPGFISGLTAAQPGWRKLVSMAQNIGIPVPAMSSSLAYFDSYRSAHLPQNLTQAQRDFFGSHLYQRVDKPDSDPVHTDWVGITGQQ